MKKKCLFLILILACFSLILFPGFCRGEEMLDQALNNLKEAYEKGELAASTLLLQFILEQKPEETRYYLDLAGIYQEKGDFYRARSTLENGLEKAADRDLIKAEMARLEVITEKTGLEIERLGSADSRDFYFYRGLHYKQLRQWPQSIADLKKAIEHDPNLIAAYYFLGLVLIETESWEAAEDVLQEGLRRDSSFTGINLLLGHLAFQRDDYHSAYNYYLRTPANLRDDQVRKRISFIQELLPPPPEKPERELREETVDFQKVKPIVDENIPLLRVALLTQGLEFSFQTEVPFNLKTLEGQNLFRGEARRTYFIDFKRGTFFLRNLQGEELFSTSKAHRLELAEQDTTLHLFDVEYGEGYFWAGREDRQYRGSFIIQPRNEEHFYLLNEVNVEEYLYSVVPSEMPASWPMEALKAQAIAARSYTMNRYYRNPDSTYHLVASVINAAYNGVNWENERSQEAVDSTRGIIATHGGRAIDAVYSANSGGYTEDSSLVWGGEVPYLQGQPVFPEYFELDLLPAGMAEWLRERPPSFSRAENYGSATSYRWTRVLLPEEPPVASRVGPISEIVPQERGKSGFVKSVLVRGKRGEEILSGDRIRSQLGGLKSNLFMVEPVFGDDNKPQYFLFWGGGWGHGVGLDQTAAAQMAADGFSHSEIIKTFYQGVDLEKRY